MSKEINISDLERFAEDRIWREIIQYAIGQIDNKVSELMTTDPITDAATICRAQGFIDGLNAIVDYPAILKEQVEYDMKEEERKNA
jgi:hypothetical protein